MDDHPPIAPPATPPSAHGQAERAPDMLVRFLADRDHACPACNYNLRGLTGARCPECNKALELRVGLVEPHLGASFVCGLVGVCMGFGIQAVIVSWAGYVTLTRGGSMVPLGEVLPLIVGVAIGAVVLVGWVRFRPRLLRWDIPIRWFLAAAATGLAFLGFAWFIWVVR